MKFDKTNRYKLFDLGNQQLKKGDKVLLISKEKAKYFKSLKLKSYNVSPLFIDDMFNYCNQIAIINWINISRKRFTIDLDETSRTWHIDFIEKIIDN